MYRENARESGVGFEASGSLHKENNSIWVLKKNISLGTWNRQEMQKYVEKSQNNFWFTKFCLIEPHSCLDPERTELNDGSGLPGPLPPRSPAGALEGRSVRLNLHRGPRERDPTALLRTGGGRAEPGPEALNRSVCPKSQHLQRSLTTGSSWQEPGLGEKGGEARCPAYLPAPPLTPIEGLCFPLSEEPII